jgi:hypothetical protein
MNELPNNLFQIADQIQLYTKDKIGLENDRFTDLFDRMFPISRRLQIENLDEETCLPPTLHVPGAGSSLLSATGVGKKYTCTSSLVWATSLYIRHLYELKPRLDPNQSDFRIVWISRKFHERKDNLPGFAQGRKIANEAEVLKALFGKMKEYCTSENECVFEEDRSFPLPKYSSKQTIRWQSVDPTVLGLTPQVELFGNANLVIGVHGGALGMTMFCEPGPQVALIELQPPAAFGNHHFHNIAHMTGRRYTALPVEQIIDANTVWEAITKYLPILLMK